jgi:hypothetical protein
MPSGRRAGPFHPGTSGKGQRPRGWSTLWQIPQLKGAMFDVPRPIIVEMYCLVARKCRILPHMLWSSMCLESAYTLKRGERAPFFSLTSRRLTSMELRKSSSARTWIMGPSVSVTRVVSCIMARVSLSCQTLKTMSRTLSVVKVVRPAMEKRKSDQQGRIGATLKVISVEDQICHSKSVRRWSSDRSYMRKVEG